MSAPCGAAWSDEPQLNQMQAIGSHNSYHLAPPAAVLATVGTLRQDAAEAWIYSHPPLGRQLSAPDRAHPAAGWFKRNDPLREFDEIQRLVKLGFLVRTRADESAPDAAQRERAFASGAQWVSIDHFAAGLPAATRVVFPGGATVPSQPAEWRKLRDAGAMRLRVIIHAIGSAGDVHPFLGIGTALRARGHEVFLVTNPAFERTVLASGLQFRALGTLQQYHETKDDPDLWHPSRAFPAVVRHAVNPSHGPILEITRELHLPGKTVMLASSLAFAARTASELLGIPYATVHLAPAILPSVFRQPEIHGLPFGSRSPRFLKRLQWKIAGRIVDHLALPELNRFRSRHGLPPAKHLLATWWNSPARVIVLFPDWFAPPQPDWPPQTRQTGFPLFDERDMQAVPTDLTDFLDAGSPPVVFTPGSAMSQGHALFREAAGALTRIGRRGIFLTPYAENLPAGLPREILAVPYAPFSQILPRCAAIIHHGGVGTCAQALQAGIPQLIQPMAHDQLDTVSRIRDLGVGFGIAPRKFREKPLAGALEKLLGDPGYSQRAREVARRFEPDRWMEQTCSYVEELILGGKVPT